MVAPWRCSWGWVVYEWFINNVGNMASGGTIRLVWSAAGVGMGVAMFLTLATSYGAISGWAQLSAAACVATNSLK